MTEAPIAVVACPTCESREIRPVFRSPDRDWGSGESFWFVRCAECGLVRIEPQPTPEELSRFYPEGNWPRAQREQDALDAWILGVPWKQLMRRRAEAIFAVVPGPARILEIGAGDGYFLRHMKDSGWEVEGVEMGQPAAEFANSKLGVKVHCGRLEDVSLSHSEYDVIYMHHVFEHLGNPLETLRQVRSLLADGGWLYLAIPNWRSLDRWMFKSRWVGLKPPQHLFLYERSTLKALLAKAGFTLKRTKTYSREGTTLIGYTESMRYVLMETGFRANEPRAPGAKAPAEPPKDSLRSDRAWKRILQRAEKLIWWPVHSVADRLGYGTALQAWAQRE